MDDLSETPSSPLSLRSKSPSPPPGYSSPLTTQYSDSRATSQSRDDCSRNSSGDGPPPAKKRKVEERNLDEPKPTEYLTLPTMNGVNEDQMTTKEEFQLQRLLHALKKKKKIVVIAGAGISVSAGVPDFRSSTGLFATLRGQHKLKTSGKHLFDAAVYKNDGSTKSFHDMVRELSKLTKDAKPTAFHHMIASIATEGRLLRLYTQNVDGIDTEMEPLATNVPLQAKGPWPKSIQLHGGLKKVVCTKCRELSDFDGALFESPEPPACPSCEETDRVRVEQAGKRSHGVGRLRPRMVLYNEFNPDEEAIGAVTAADLKTRPDAVIVVGTSLKVPGVRRIVKEMTWVARGRRDGFTAWINNGPEPIGIDMTGCWDIVVRGDCQDVAFLAGLRKWNDYDNGESVEMDAESYNEKLISARKSQPEISGEGVFRNEPIEVAKGDLCHEMISQAETASSEIVTLKPTQTTLASDSFGHTLTLERKKPEAEIAEKKKATKGPKAKATKKPTSATKNAKKSTATTDRTNSKSISQSFAVKKGSKSNAKVKDSDAIDSKVPPEISREISSSFKKKIASVPPISNSAPQTQNKDSVQPYDHADDKILTQRQLLGSSSIVETPTLGPSDTKNEYSTGSNLYRIGWINSNPARVKTEIENSFGSQNLDDEQIAIESSNGAFSTTELEWSPQRRRETISPKSKPRNMELLIS